MTFHSTPNPPHARYSQKPFPPYRFILGENPHPTADPAGHLYGKEEEDPGTLTLENWSTNETYLYGVDLYNYAYWWEAHEAFEGLWREFPPVVIEAHFLQGLIKIAAAFYKWQLQDRRGVEIHYAGGAELLGEVAARHPVYMGLDLKDHLGKLEKQFKKVLGTQLPSDPEPQSTRWPDPLEDYPFIVLKQ